MELLAFIHTKKVHINLIPSAKAVHLQPYPVPYLHLQKFKCELDHLIEIDILVPPKESEWASPTFIIQKKDGCVH
jgi:hypothetical protein